MEVLIKEHVFKVKQKIRLGVVLFTYSVLYVDSELPFNPEELVT